MLSCNHDIWSTIVTVHLVIYLVALLNEIPLFGQTGFKRFLILQFHYFQNWIFCIGVLQYFYSQFVLQEALPSNKMAVLKIAFSCLSISSSNSCCTDGLTRTVFELLLLLEDRISCFLSRISRNELRAILRPIFNEMKRDPVLSKFSSASFIIFF